MQWNTLLVFLCSPPLLNDNSFPTDAVFVLLAFLGYIFLAIIRRGGLLFISCRPIRFFCVNWCSELLRDNGFVFHRAVLQWWGIQQCSGVWEDGALLLPASEHWRFSVASLKELGLAGGKRTAQMWEDGSCPREKLKRCLRGENQSRRTFGGWALPKHTQRWLERTSLLQVWLEEKKHESFAASPQFPLFLFHKNKRWTFKVRVSALFDILLCSCPNYWPRPSE